MGTVLFSPFVSKGQGALYDTATAEGKPGRRGACVADGVAASRRGGRAVSEERGFCRRRRRTARSQRLTPRHGRLKRRPVVFGVEAHLEQAVPSWVEDTSLAKYPHRAEQTAFPASSKTCYTLDHPIPHHGNELFQRFWAWYALLIFHGFTTKLKTRALYYIIVPAVKYYRLPINHPQSRQL